MYRYHVTQVGRSTLPTLLVSATDWLGTLLSATFWSSPAKVKVKQPSEVPLLPFPFTPPSPTIRHRLFFCSASRSSIPHTRPRPLIRLQNIHLTPPSRLVSEPLLLCPSCHPLLDLWTLSNSLPSPHSYPPPVQHSAPPPSPRHPFDTPHSPPLTHTTGN